MKNNKRILAVLVASAFTTVSVYAQITPTNQANTVPINTPVNVGQGNTYEKEVTPLLRDISKKKSLLELRKLDRELEKLEEETLTAQIERDKALNPPAPITPAAPGFGLPSLAPAPLPAATTSSTEESNLRVLMVYGFDNNLYAKVSNGTQGGYTVQKGDILPDGRVVTNITPNFLEVKKAAKSKGGNTQKLYVSGPVPVKATMTSTAGGNGLPSTAPNALPNPGTTFIPPGGVTPLAGTGAVPLGTGVTLSMPNSAVKK
jgi:type IV pilus biogenesis protein PilP